MATRKPSIEATSSEIKAVITKYEPTITLYRVLQINKKEGPKLFSAKYRCRIDEPLHVRWIKDSSQPYKEDQTKMMPRSWSDWNYQQLSKTPEEAWNKFLEELEIDREESLKYLKNLEITISRTEYQLKKLEKCKGE
jgi:hypothetical protein